MESETGSSVTSRERAAFEAGIKLGGIFHQFTGTPVSRDNASEIERAMEAAVRAQPFVRDIRVRINREMLSRRCRKGTGKIGDGYTTLTGEMLDVMLTVAFNDAEVRASMRYVESLDYPLMRIEEIKETEE